MLPGILLDECLTEEMDRRGVPLHHGRRVPDSLGCLYVGCSSSAFIPLSHKGHALGSGKATCSASGACSQSRVHICTLGVCFNHLVTMASLFQSSTRLD